MCSTGSQVSALTGIRITGCSQPMTTGTATVTGRDQQAYRARGFDAMPRSLPEWIAIRAARTRLLDRRRAVKRQPPNMRSENATTPAIQGYEPR